MAEQTLVQHIVFAYWIRTKLSPRYIFTDELIKITIKYIPNPPSFYDWDSDRCHHSLMISNENKTITSKAFGPKSVFSKYVIGGRNRIIRWEVTLRKNPYLFGSGLMRMGIMDAKYIDDAYVGSEIGDQNHQIALKLAAYRFPERVIDTKWSSFASNQVVPVSAKLEFKNGQCNAYCNDKLLGILIDDLPEMFYLALIQRLIQRSGHMIDPARGPT